MGNELRKKPQKLRMDGCIGKRREKGRGADLGYNIKQNSFSGSAHLLGLRRSLHHLDGAR
jgi:hypothetical protein